MSTWSAVINVTDKFKDHVVLCTGELVPHISSEGDIRRHHFSHTSFVVPMSTFAIALGVWEIRVLECTHPVTRFIGEDKSITHTYTCLQCNNMENVLGPKALVDKTFPVVSSYISHCLSAAQSVLGTYPLPRLDIVIVHRSFSGLGLASPHLMFLSPRYVYSAVAVCKGFDALMNQRTCIFSLFSGDIDQYIKISHEVSHAWFGIIVGSLDWTEAWISEGFATFLEEVIHKETLRLQGTSLPEEVDVLRSIIKFESLRDEVGTTEQEMQILQPMKGKFRKT